MKTKNNNWGFIIVILAAVFFAVSFVIAPMTSDIKVFLASAHQASYISDNLLIGSYKVWELKSTFSRMLIYAIYKIADIFTIYGTYEFGVASKIVYAAMTFAICMASVWLVSDNSRKNKLIEAMLIFIGYTAVHTSCALQVEMTACLVVMLSLGLYVNAIKTEKLYAVKLFTAGMLIGSVFFLKSVLILLSVSVVAAVAVWCIKNDKKLSFKRMMIVVAGSVFMLAVNSGIILLVNPAEFQDMIDASAFQNTLFTKELSFELVKRVAKKFIFEGTKCLYLMPAIVVGVVAYLCNFVKNISAKKWWLVVYHTVMWCMPAIFVILSNKYFEYHMMAYMFPATVEIYYLVKDNTKVAKIIASATAVAMFGLYIVFFSAVSANMKGYIRTDKHAFAARDAIFEQVDFDTEAEMMYLDDGLGAYYLPNRSHLKYFFPLPLQRLRDSDLECYTSTKQQVFDYQGKYISVYENWFFDGKNADIREKIDAEYRYIGSYERFSPPKDLINDRFESKPFDLYERIE